MSSVLDSISMLLTCLLNKCLKGYNFKVIIRTDICFFFSEDWRDCMIALWEKHILTETLKHVHYRHCQNWVHNTGHVLNFSFEFYEFLYIYVCKIVLFYLL